MENNIYENLPQIPYVVDQVSDALKWAKEVLKESEYEHMLRVVTDVSAYAKKISVPEFFKTHLVVASILLAIPDAKKDERFKRFDTASKAVEKALDALEVPKEKIKERGCFKAIALTLIPLANVNEEYFTIALTGVKHDLLDILEGMKPAGVKDPITSQDYVVILGYALLMANIRMSNLNLGNDAYKVYNDIEILLNSEFNY